MYCEKQILLGNQIVKQFNRNILHFDATGSVVAKTSEWGRVFLYSLVLPVPIKGEPALPVLEWLSDHHDSLFKRLSSWCLSLKKILSHPAVVVTDNSWAFLHAVSESFNHVSLIEQINFQWQIMNGAQQQKTILRLCCSHYLSALSKRLAKKKMTSKVSVESTYYQV